MVAKVMPELMRRGGQPGCGQATNDTPNNYLHSHKIADRNVFIKSETEFGGRRSQSKTEQKLPPPRSL